MPNNIDIKQFLEAQNLSDEDAIDILNEALGQTQRGQDLVSSLVGIIDQRNLSMRQVEDAILSIPYDDGTKEFWSDNHDLLDATERWDFDYSDMGYGD